MTMVRTRMLLDSMKTGDYAEIRLKGEEPLRNVPQSIRELGDEVVKIETTDSAEGEVEGRLIVCRRRD